MPRYRFVRQNDESDCGAAALATVALQYRLPLSLEKLRDLTETDRVGTSLLGLLEAAEQLGFSARGLHGSYDALSNLPLPAIAHTRDEEDGSGHFIVLHRVRKKHVIVADPAHEGIEKLSRQEFCRRWTGHVLQLVPERPLTGTEGASRSTTSWGRLVHLLRGHSGILGEAFCCAILMTILGVATSYFIQHLVDSVLVQGEAHLLNALGIGMILILVMRTLFAVLRHYLLAFLGRKVDLSLTAGFTRHILRLPLRFFETRQVGEILSRAHDAENIREAISGTALTAVVDATLVLLTFGILWLYDWPLAMVATAFAPLLVAGVLLHHRATRRRSREAMERDAHFYSHLAEDVSGIETIKAFGAERARQDEDELRLVRVVQSVFGLEKLGISMTTLATIVTGLAGLVILWFGGHRVISGALTIGQLLFFYSMLDYLLQPLERLSLVNLEIQEASVALDRLYQVLDVEEEKLADRNRVQFSGLSRAVVLEDVGFRYGRRGDVLKNVCLEIPAGQTVALVGESGSGKSTLVRLLMGLYLPTDGRVVFDGVDLRDMDLASLRRRIGLVAQEPFIFSGTIAENISFGRPGAPRRQIVDAARAAGLEPFVAGQPDRYETMLGERGANLSGGQRQRLAIARALLCRPEILIFDEATSHLDSATEQALQQSLAAELAGKTVVWVSHRLSSIRHADRIYVLDQGRLEQGTHEQLLEQRGRYAWLWQAQLGDAESAPPRNRGAAVPAAPSGNGREVLRTKAEP